MEKKTGESVEITMVGKDAEGQVISEVTWNTFGYENQYANAFQTLVLSKLVELTNELSAAKAELQKQQKR